MIAAMHGKELPNLVKLAKLVLIFPLQTATYERGFSVQNCTKTVTRNRLQESNLHALMNICINGPSLDTSPETLENNKGQETILKLKFNKLK